MTNLTDKPVVLVVDDDPTNLRYVDEILKDNYKVYLAPSGERALSFLKGRKPNLILLDVEMPGMNGYEVIRRIKENPGWADIPVIFLTGQEGREKEQEALDLGAVDYILKPISPGIVRSRAGMQIELGAYRKNLEQMVEVRTEQLRRTQDVILDILASMTSFRDNETGAHIVRTTIYSDLLIKNLIKKRHPQYMIDEAYAKSVVKCAKLHDIGKVAVPDNILLKPARLNPLEFEMIKQHTVYGAQILDQASGELGETSSFLNVAREIIISHHEKWNGSGYPMGLEGTDIPLSGRIMAIADVYDALISHRPYKPSYPHAVAIETITRDSGTHFDPTLIELSMNVMEEFEQIAIRHEDKPYATLYDSPDYTAHTPEVI
jgi:putative two-component system response regulator